MYSGATSSSPGQHSDAVLHEELPKNCVILEQFENGSGLVKDHGAEIGDTLASIDKRNSQPVFAEVVGIQYVKHDLSFTKLAARSC